MIAEQDHGLGFSVVTFQPALADPVDVPAAVFEVADVVLLAAASRQAVQSGRQRVRSITIPYLRVVAESSAVTRVDVEVISTRAATAQPVPVRGQPTPMAGARGTGAVAAEMKSRRAPRNKARVMEEPRPVTFLKAARAIASASRTRRPTWKNGLPSLDR